MGQEQWTALQTGEFPASWALIDTSEHQRLFQAVLGEVNIGRNHPQERHSVKLRLTP